MSAGVHQRHNQGPKSNKERQPLWATVGLAVVTLSGLAAITYIRVKTNEVPAGIVAITTSAVTALAMSAGRRRL